VFQISIQPKKKSVSNLERITYMHGFKNWNSQITRKESDFQFLPNQFSICSQLN